MGGIKYGLVDAEAIKSFGGLEFLKGIVNGTQPQPPISELLGFHLVEIEEGRAVFEGLPEYRHYNPIGTVHGGLAATLLELGARLRHLLDAGQRRRLDHTRTQTELRAANDQGHRAGARGRPHYPSRPHGGDLAG